MCKSASDLTPSCNYVPVGVGNCDYRAFDREMAKAKMECNDVNDPGSSGYCNKLLKDGYDVALLCHCSDEPTTTTTTGPVTNTHHHHPHTHNHNQSPTHHTHGESPLTTTTSTRGDFQL